MKNMLNIHALALALFGCVFLILCTLSLSIMHTLNMHKLKKRNPQITLYKATFWIGINIIKLLQ